MNCFRWVQGLAVVLILVAAGPAVAESTGEEVAAALAAAPPSLPMTEARLEALTALDAFIAHPQSQDDPAVIAFYREAVDRGLDKLENERVTSGIRVFQFYSSSVVVQTPETVFAFDLDTGPNDGLDQKSADEGEPFHLTDAQVARLAKLVDYVFLTHLHLDHCDWQITDALMAEGKTVVVNPEHKEMWKDQPWAEKLVLLEQTIDEPNEVGPLKVHVLFDRQWGRDVRHSSGAQCDCYVITTPGGLTVMNKGDINCGLQLFGWLNLLKLNGVEIDVVTGSTIFWRGVDITAEWNALLDNPIWLPGHTWEFGHRRGQAVGNSIPFVKAFHLVNEPTGSDLVQPLSWGEWIDIDVK